MQSTDADNYSLISFRDNAGNEQAKMGYNPQNGVNINNSTIVTTSDLSMPDFSSVKFYLYNNNQELVMEFARGAEKYQLALTQSGIVYRYYNGTSWGNVWVK